MPHSLYLGSAIVKPRLLDYDIKKGYMSPDTQEAIANDPVFYEQYRPSVGTINHALKFSIVELTISLFTFALFVNSAILIIAGATIYGTEASNDADLYSIHRTLLTQLSSVAGTIFMLALLFSGQSAGIICTIAGQIVSEGYLHWTIRPWLRRLVTRAIAIVPCVVVAGAVGKKGLNATLNASQVALSILLPFLVAPLIYFTCKHSIMTIPADNVDQEELEKASDEISDTPKSIIVETIRPWTMDNDTQLSIEKLPVATLNYRAGPPLTKSVSYKNNILTMILGVLVWLFIAILNVYLLVALGQGKTG